MQRKLHRVKMKEIRVKTDKHMKIYNTRVTVEKKLEARDICI